MTTAALPGVLLAGGPGSRFAGPTHKLFANFNGRPVIAWSIDAIRTAGLRPWVVWGATAPDGLGITFGDDVVMLDNPRWAHGMATTLAVAIDEATRQGVPAIVVGPADQPMIPASAWQRIARAPAEIAVATYGGRRANPVLLKASVWSEMPTSGDFGARHVMKMRPELVLEVACEGNPADIDTLEDLKLWNSSTNSQ